MSAATPAQVAKGALRRLALAKHEPTPENYARAYAEEAGQPPPATTAAEARQQGPAWALLIEKLVRGLERGGRQWTPARKKESLQRVLDGSRGDLQRLQQRLQSLVAAWEGDRGDGSGDEATVPEPAAAETAAPGDWQPVVATLEGTVRIALPAGDPRAAELADRLGRCADALAAEGPGAARIAEIEALCEQARRLLGHRHRLVDQLGALCRELGDGLVELAEDESWARGQCEGLQARLAEGLSARAVRAASELLAETRTRQKRVRDERNAARDALKAVLAGMLDEVAALGEATGRFDDRVGRHAEAIAAAQSIEGLAGVVRELLDESRAVRTRVGQAQQRLRDEHARAGELERRVRELESELRRLSDEVSTDALTQVANRRGLAAAFDAERERVERGAAASLAVALIDIDNFKKLNDSLGHAAGDQALKSLAAAVRERLRPGDHLARFGGEEFVVLLPQTPAGEAQQALTRLQRSLSEALFLHDQQEVFVTFSAGVTGWRAGETLDAALERADEALYEAKRTGKNRTCVA